MMLRTSSTLLINKEQMINFFRKLFKKKQEPLYANCLNSRSWLDRQVDEALYKRDALRGGVGSTVNLFTEKDASHMLKVSDNWYDKYYDNEK